MTGFVQLIEYRTSRPDEIAALMSDYRGKREAEAADGPSPTRVMVCSDRDESGRYTSIVEFASYEEAMENSNRPDTSEFASALMELCDGPPTFHNLDLLEVEEFQRKS
ncbi:hypothetical protein BWI15_13935 [Kribbella sp. ALI-6-A]|uniref:hypothetical protein n=1 Tax=Kribbella sp. ALI-6-A TaxID=1933817 RepID=UPI00097C782C|nr:hypothetical protein [Kribbella sp. ALI-6-A]ONI74406.1 hypothetical protein BWI15_13935 [Kribbella sp. ALI-6-A]